MKFYSCDICGKIFDNQSLEICIVCKSKICENCFKNIGGYCRHCNTKILKNLDNEHKNN